MHFANTSFQLIPPRSVDRDFLLHHCFSIHQLIEYYQLEAIVFCERAVNIDRVAEFYNNLHTADGIHYKSRVAKTNIDFDNRILGEYLGCRPSPSTFICYPTLPEILPPPFDQITIDLMHQELLHRPRPDGPDSTITAFRALRMTAIDYVLFKIVVNCLLPITSRALALVRPPQLFLMYALLHRLDIDIVAHITASILHHSSSVHGKVHMPFGHILTGWLESLGIDVSRGKIEKLSKKYSRLGPRAFSKSKIVLEYGGVRWADGRAPGTLPVAAPGAMDIEEEPAAEGEAAAEEAEAAEEEEDPDYPEEPDYQTQIAAMDSRFAELGVRMDSGLLRLESRVDAGFSEMRGQFREMRGQVTGLYDMVQAWMLGHPPPQSSSSAPPDAAPSTADPTGVLSDPDVVLRDEMVDPTTGEMSFRVNALGD